MTPVERNERIFQASIGCSSAAVEFLRSVNKPLNVTYIAQTAWDIAKKLEEFMEVHTQRELEAEAAGNANAAAAQPTAAPAASTPAPAQAAKPATPAAANRFSDADLVPLK
ncbi:MAG: hypothetical protein ACK4PI_03805 [Tepidisphaerales bacterium]